MLKILLKNKIYLNKKFCYMILWNSWIHCFARDDVLIECTCFSISVISVKVIRWITAIHGKLKKWLYWVLITSLGICKNQTWRWGNFCKGCFTNKYNHVSLYTVLWNQAIMHKYFNSAVRWHTCVYVRELRSVVYRKGIL